ncbi:MAG: OmpA family protein [Pseudomonadota bacterium]
MISAWRMAPAFLLASTTLAWAQGPAVPERVAALRDALEEAIALVEARRLQLGEDPADLGAEEALGQFVTEIVFQTGDVSVDGASRQRLTGVAQAMKQLGVPRVRVVGYSDRTGPVNVNADLALRRAEVVGRMFVEAGFRTDQIETISALEAGLPLPVATPEGVAEPRNRSARVFATPG